MNKKVNALKILAEENYSAKLWVMENSLGDQKVANNHKVANNRWLAAHFLRF